MPNVIDQLLHRPANRSTAQALARLQALARARHITLAITDGDAPQAPTELRLFKAGANDTTKGVFYFTEASADSVMRAAADWGNDFSFDYEHGALTSSGEPAPAAGWFDLEIRRTDAGPELWAVNIRWTDRAKQMIEAKELRYISPTFATGKGGEILSLFNCAVTNVPATKHMDAMIAAAAAIEAGLSVDDLISQTQALLEPEHPHLASAWAVDVRLDLVVFALEDGRSWAVPITITGETVELAGEPVEVTREWVPVTPPSTEGSTDMKLTPTTLIALGLAATATEQEVDAAVERLAGQLQALTALVPEGQDALGTITAWRDAAARVEALSARVAELEAATAQRELGELLDAAEADGKLTPAQRETLVQAFTSDAGAVNLQALRAYVEASPRILTPSGAREPTPKDGAGAQAGRPDTTGKTWSQLSNVERHNLRVTDPEEFERLYQEHQAAKAN